MTTPTEKTPAPQEQENTPVQENKAPAAAAPLTEKDRSLDARGRRRWLPTVVQACASALDVILEKFFAEKVYTYKKGEGYPRVEIRGNGVISVPLEELYRSTKARENLEAMRKRMQAIYEEHGMVEVKQPAPKVSKATSAPKAPAAKKRKRAAPEKPVN